MHIATLLSQRVEHDVVLLGIGLGQRGDVDLTDVEVGIDLDTGDRDESEVVVVDSFEVTRDDLGEQRVQAGRARIVARAALALSTTIATATATTAPTGVAGREGSKTG